MNQISRLLVMYLQYVTLEEYFKREPAKIAVKVFSEFCNLFLTR